MGNQQGQSKSSSKKPIRVDRIKLECVCSKLKEYLKLQESREMSNGNQKWKELINLISGKQRSRDAELHKLIEMNRIENYVEAVKILTRCTEAIQQRSALLLANQGDSTALKEIEPLAHNLVWASPYLKLDSLEQFAEVMSVFFGGSGVDGTDLHTIVKDSSLVDPKLKACFAIPDMKTYTKQMNEYAIMLTKEGFSLETINDVGHPFHNDLAQFEINAAKFNPSNNHIHPIVNGGAFNQQQQQQQQFYPQQQPQQPQFQQQYQQQPYQQTWQQQQQQPWGGQQQFQPQPQQANRLPMQSQIPQSQSQQQQQPPQYQNYQNNNQSNQQHPNLQQFQQQPYPQQQQNQQQPFPQPSAASQFPQQPGQPMVKSYFPQNENAQPSSIQQPKREVSSIQKNWDYISNTGNDYNNDNNPNEMNQGGEEPRTINGVPILFNFEQSLNVTDSQVPANYNNNYNDNINFDAGSQVQQNDYNPFKSDVSSVHPVVTQEQLQQQAKYPTLKPININHTQKLNGIQENIKKQQQVLENQKRDDLLQEEFKNNLLNLQKQLASTIISPQQGQANHAVIAAAPIENKQQINNYSLQSQVPCTQNEQKQQFIQPREQQQQSEQQPEQREECNFDSKVVILGYQDMMKQMTENVQQNQNIPNNSNNIGVMSGIFKDFGEQRNYGNDFAYSQSQISHPRYSRE